MRIHLATVAAALFLVFGAGTGRVVGDRSSPGVDPRLEPLAFIQGDWACSLGEDLLHEQWSAPMGDTMMGTFRWMKPTEGEVGMRAWIYELLVIRAEEARVSLLFRHFGNDMTAWEPVDEPIVLVLDVADSGPGRAMFRNATEGATPKAMLFERTDHGVLVTVGEGDEFFKVDYRPIDQVKLDD